MKRVQIEIEDELDAVLEQRASATGKSKAGLIRDLLRERLEPRPPSEPDPLSRMIGADDFEPESVDDVVYG